MTPKPPIPSTPTASQPAEPLDLLRAQMRQPPHNLWMGARALSADPVARVIETELTFRPEMSGREGEAMFHGGIVASFIDLTGHAAVAVWLGGGTTPTIGLQIDYLAPAIGPRLIARGMLRKAGRAIACADVEVRAADRLVALGRGRFSTRGSNA